MQINETNFEYRAMTPRNISQINRIILHHSDASISSPEDIHRWHLLRGFSGAGYNFLVRKDGSIYSLRPLEYVPAQAKGFNTISIGICFEGNFMEETMDDVQKNAGSELVSYLKDKYGLSLVQKHRDVNATVCPGDNFPFDEIANSAVSPVEEHKVESDLVKDYVLNYQKAYNTVYNPKIAEDGIYGTETDRSKYKVLLVKGNRNELVRWCQDRLINHKGYSMQYGADSSFGSETENVVREFQSDNGLSVDGKIGIQTISLLF